MHMQKESRVYGNNTYTVGEVWEAKFNPKHYYGTIIGFRLDDTPVIEDADGSITTLTNESWTKRKEKLKLKLNLCKYNPTGAFFVQAEDALILPTYTFVQTIEVEQE